MRQYVPWRMSGLRLGSEMSDEQRNKICESCKGKKRGNQHANKPILQLDMEGNFIRRWESASQAARGVGRAVCSIALCAQGLVRHSAGFKWKYENE